MATREKRAAAPARRSASQQLSDAGDEGSRPERAARARKSAQVDRVRVWWPPTRVKSRTGFGGAYWPAAVIRKAASTLEVEYDNGERESVEPERIFPYEVPLDFGKEYKALQAGEFVEVSNNSKTDPCAWLGCIASLGKDGKHLIDYPFHDSPSEYIKVERLRRARVWDDLDWKYIELGQTWKPGEVTVPTELRLLTEQEYFAKLKQQASKGKRAPVVAAPAAGTDSSSLSPSGSSDEDTDEEQGSSEEEQRQQLQQQQQQQAKGRKRGRKPSHPARSSMMDDGANGSVDKKSRLTGARKRKPAAVRQA